MRVAKEIENKDDNSMICPTVIIIRGTAMTHHTIGGRRGRGGRRTGSWQRWRKPAPNLGKTRICNRFQSQNCKIFYWKSNSPDSMQQNIGAHSNLILLTVLEGTINYKLGEVVMIGIAIQEAQYRKLDDINWITCHSSIIHGGAVSINGVVMQTTDINAKLTVMLLGTLSDEALGNYYTIVPKGINIHLGKEYYDKLILQNNVQINNRHAITLINIVDPRLFTLK